MKLATGIVDGRTVWGPVVDGALHDVSAMWVSPSALAAASADLAGRVALGRAADDAVDDDVHDLEHVQLLPPVPEPRRILCIGVNYAEHAAESDRSAEADAHPVVFTRFASSLVGHRQPVVRPTASTEFDYEGELAVVIGRTVRAVDRRDAIAAVAGYSCFMDGTLRDFQRHTSQFTPGKNFDRSGSWGPWIVTLDEVGDGSALQLTTTLDGEVVQQASTSQMIHDVAAIVAYCSRFTTLEPGDVIATGTPGGVGYARTPQRWLTPGAEVAVTVGGVGSLRNTVVEEADAHTIDAITSASERTLETQNTASHSGR